MYAIENYFFLIWNANYLRGGGARVIIYYIKHK